MDSRDPNGKGLTAVAQSRLGSLSTAEVKALVDQSTDVVEMYGTADVETVRRYTVGIPDQDPHHWDEELAKDRFGTTTAPGVMLLRATGAVGRGADLLLEPRRPLDANRTWRRDRAAKANAGRKHGGNGTTHVAAQEVQSAGNSVGA